jgi:hypothetical protein
MRKLLTHLFAMVECCVVYHTSSLHFQLINSKAITQLLGILQHKILENCVHAEYELLIYYHYFVEKTNFIEHLILSNWYNTMFPKIAL